MRIAARAARIGNNIIDIFAAVLVVLMLLYGGYSLWDNWRINHAALSSDELLQYKPTPGDTESLAELMAINPDVIGWITIDDTHIDYPLVQGKDDMEYVNKDVHGDFALSGSIFLSCINSRDLSDPYSLIYGHHMSNGAMFGDITEFTEESYFNSHRTGTIYLPDRTIDVQLFACVKTDASDAVVYDPQQQSGNIAELLSYLEENSAQYRDIGVSQEDRVVGLSTCSEAVTNGRVIVYGKLVNEVTTDNREVSDEHE
ncbi:MAG: class B sortase [Lachnospiraceae bacterium]|nr:class B sortase [Lachnospiraceae bacterium]